MVKDIQLLITNPCLENWHDMHQATAGRYCDRCEKTIVDFTTKSDAELLHFFKNKKENICGRLLTSQLNRNLVIPPTKMKWHWLLPLAFGAMLVNPAQAQQLKPVVVQGDKKSSLHPPSVKSDSLKLAKDTIGGTKIDELTDKPTDTMKIAPKGSQTIRIGGVSAVDPDKVPLYVVNVGTKSCTVDASIMKEISPEWIEALDIIKDASATATYGAKGANGVIIIKIKEAYADKIDFSKQKMKD